MNGRARLCLRTGGGKSGLEIASLVGSRDHVHQLSFVAALVP